MKDLIDLIIEKAVLKDLALKICQYNDQKGTEKQIEKCIKSFGGSIQLMEQFAKNRIK